MALRQKKNKNNNNKNNTRIRRYPRETITDTDMADDIVLLANTPAQAESLLHSQGKVAAGGIGLCVNANETEYMYFKATSKISRQVHIHR